MTVIENNVNIFLILFNRTENKKIGLQKISQSDYFMFQKVLLKTFFGNIFHRIFDQHIYDGKKFVA